MSTTAETGSTDPSASPGMDGTDSDFAKRWWVLAVLGTAQLMVVLDSTVVNIALPAAQRDLGFSNDNRQWIVTSYALAFGSLLLLGGRLADLVGRKQVFLVGLVGFALASAVGGAANGFPLLVAARAVQGGFGALLAPAALSLVSTTFVEPAERSKAFGIFGAIAGGGAAIGLLLGGVLTEYASWRWCMFVNIFFAAAALAGGLLLLRSRRDQHSDPLDIPGTFLISVGLFAIVYGFAHAGTDGWANFVTLAALIVGVALIAVFVIVEARVAHPLLPMRVILDRNRSGSYLAVFVVGIGSFAVFLFLTYYLQLSLGFSAVQSGLAYLPMTAVLVAASQLSVTVLVGRLGPRWIIAAGMAVAAGGLALLTRLGASSSYGPDVFPALLIFGAGLGLVFSVSLAGSTSGVDASDSGVASAMVNVGQQVGGSIGTALLSTLAATSVADYAHSHPPGPKLANAAAIHGYTTAFGWGAVIFAIGAILTGILMRSEVIEVNADAVPVG